MSYDGRIRFDANALDRHADEYSKKELRLARELVEALRMAASCAPIEAAPRVRRLMNEADHLARYFSGIGDALIEAGQRVQAVSQSMLERLENATADIETLLN